MIMADNKKKLTHKVTLIQGGTEATFRLTDKEFNALERCKFIYHGKCYNFSIFAWADYTISRSKRKRFHSIFNYHNGDFIFFEE